MRNAQKKAPLAELPLEVVARMENRSLGPLEEHILEWPAFARAYYRLHEASRRYHLQNLETCAAELPELERGFADLVALPHSRRLELLRHPEDDTAPRFFTWLLAMRLLEESQERTPLLPRQGYQLAEAALAITRHLRAREYGGKAPLAELQALAWAHQGNALRVEGNLAEAAPHFTQAAELLEGHRPAVAALRAHTLWRLGAFERDRRDGAAARLHTEQALIWARGQQSPLLTGALLLQRASLDYEVGNLDGAIDSCQQVLTRLPRGSRSPLHTSAQVNLAHYMMRSGQFRAARKALRSAKGQLRELPVAARVRVGWIEAAIQRGLGHLAEAEASYRQVRRGFLRLGRAFDGAIVTLELALLLLEQGRTAEVASLAQEIHPIFEREGVHREAQAAVLLLRDAAAQERLTALMVIQLLGRLRGDG